MTTVAAGEASKGLRDLVALLREERNHEYKRSASWGALKHKIAKTAMAMANTPDGGVIIVGVQENGDDTFTATGIATADRGTFAEDTVRSFVNRFADPSIRLNLVLLSDGGLEFLAIEVPEADDLPVICCKDGQDMRAGALYVRPRGKAETREPQSAFETRELLDLASMKRARILLGQMRELGLTPGSTAQMNDEAAFDNQISGLRPYNRE